ncbi:hypothetical protein L9F63_018605 [Diploptera punctata]|uniref:CRAL-TRIO domain-containing protein n=1 Tax=Diploptera punctata TaxID=6984 RepID=A0AAD7ZW20_DIPPU|nr:hypothetical protein L9F63_018605 [Diploptera punctata]
MPHNYFKEGVCQPPASRADDLKHMRNWLSGQHHLPALSDEHLYLFLNCCDYQLTKAKETIDNYYTLRTSSPELFGNRNPLLPEIQAILNVVNMIPMSWKTPEGYKVLLYRLTDYDSSKLPFITAVKTLFMFNDMRTSESGLVTGYIAIMDFKGVGLGHVANVHLMTLKKGLTYIQDCLPASLKAVHIINTPSCIDKIMMLVKPLIKSELLGMLKFHGPPEDLADYVSLKSLPEEYGGEGESFEKIYAEQRTLMEKDYIKWFQLEETLKADESKRTGKQNPYSEITQGAEGSFRKLAID